MRTVLRILALVTLIFVGMQALGRWLISTQETDVLDGLPAGVPGRMILVDGRRVHVVERGIGPPLLLVHGFGASTFNWEQHVQEPLAETHRTIAVDLWGMGFSERRVDFDPSFSGFAEQLVGVLDALGIERAAVAGHSMGGAAAVLLAAQHPERVEQLVLVGALAPAPPSEVPWIFLVMRTPILGEVGLGLTDNLAPPYAPPDYHARMASVSRIAGTRDALLRYVRRPNKFSELEAAYPALRAPTLLIHGTADASVPYSAMERAARVIPQARIVSAQGRGHWLLWEAPDLVVREMRSFLSGP
jgi:pimeloyl-ACP methyl ester carboxylesterase